MTQRCVARAVRRSAFTPTLLRAWLLALVLVASQAAGLAHRIVHAPGGLAGNSAIVKTSGLPSASQAAAKTAGLWSSSHEQGSAECRLIDQLAHADVLCAAPLGVLPTLPPAATAPTQHTTPLLAATAAAYQARAPPQA